MTGVVEAWIRAEESERVLRGLRRMLIGLDAWEDGPVKDAAQEAVREEIARVGRAMVGLDWRWA